LSICQSDSQERDEAVAQEATHFGPINRGRARTPATGRSPSTHPAREVRVLKRHGMGEGESELGADFGPLTYVHLMNIVSCISDFQCS
jgi:hypothetical protein